MKKELTELERLDLAARAQVTEKTVSYQSVIMFFFSAFFALVAIMSSLPFSQKLASGALAVITLLPAVMMWLRQRYALYALAIAYAPLAVGFPWLTAQEPGKHRDWFVGIGYCLVFLNLGYRYWKLARPFAAVHSPGLEKEEAQVRYWLKVMKTTGESRVLKFDTGSFWTGYFTYRLLNPGDCWAVARFKSAKRPEWEQLVDYRILAPSAVRFGELPDGNLSIDIENRSIRKIRVSPEMRPSFSSLAKAIIAQ